MILTSYTRAGDPSEWQRNDFASSGFGARTCDGSDKFRIPQDVERLFDRLKIVGTDQDK